MEPNANGQRAGCVALSSCKERAAAGGERARPRSALWYVSSRPGIKVAEGNFYQAIAGRTDPRSGLHRRPESART